MIVPALIRHRWPLLAPVLGPPVALVCLVVALMLTELERRAEDRAWRVLRRETHRSGTRVPGEAE